MGSARRIVHDLSTAVKQRRGVACGRRKNLSTAAGNPIASATRIDLSTANKNRDICTALRQWKGTPQWPSSQIRSFDNPFTRHDLDEVGYTVDVADLLFTPERDFLVKNNGQKIKVDDLRGKTIVLFIVPVDEQIWSDIDVTGDTWDMNDAYCQLLSIESAVEFVCVPVRLCSPAGSVDDRQGALFHKLFSTMPFPAIPFSDAQALEGPVVQTFSLDHPWCLDNGLLPYWVVIDPTDTVVATRCSYPNIFKLFGGAELHPLSRERIEDLEASHESEPRLQRIGKWDQLLASDTRDFLLSSNGDKVPISDLKGKLVGLYFCENVPQPPRMEAIKKVYEEAKSRGYDFEIVQITFHYHPFNAKHLDTNPTVQQRCEDVSWLTLPFKDPSCRKVQRILHCDDEEDEHWVGEEWGADLYLTEHWAGDSLVLIYPHNAEAEADHSSDVLFELSGAEILQRWGIEGYPFTRKSLYEAEYEVQKSELTLPLLLPSVQCLLRKVGDGFELVDASSQLSGKKVLVLFAPHYEGQCDCGGNFVSMLKSEYLAQLEDNVEEESKFEVMYVSTRGTAPSFIEFTKDMPWLVLPVSSNSNMSLLFKVFKVNVTHACAAAFNEQGKLIAKAHQLPEKMEGDKLKFPFIDQDLEQCIRSNVEAMCHVSNYDG